MAAELGNQLTCAVLGKFGLQQSSELNPGIHDPMQLRRQAAGIVAATLWHVQSDDELFPLAGQLDFFHELGSKDKQLVVFPGEHGTTADAAVDVWVTFLVRNLST